MIIYIEGESNKAISIHNPHMEGWELKSILLALSGQRTTMLELPLGFSSLMITIFDFIGFNIFPLRDLSQWIGILNYVFS